MKMGEDGEQGLAGPWVELLGKRPVFSVMRRRGNGWRVWVDQGGRQHLDTHAVSCWFLNGGGPNRREQQVTWRAQEPREGCLLGPL